MIIDNIVVNAIKRELNTKLIGTRINKIFQPSFDSFLFELWNNKNIFRLLISLNQQSYRVCLTDREIERTKQASNFCLQLKKYLESGLIIEIEQLNFDRILSFKIEALDNLRDKILVYLIIELTGKYSNLILLDKDKKIITSYKAITEEQNQERQILSGSSYCPITNKHEKLSLFDFDFNAFKNSLEKNQNLLPKKFLTNSFVGISSHTSEILLETLKDKKLAELSQDEEINLFNKLKNFATDIENENIYLNFNLEDLSNLDFTLSSESINQKDVLYIIDDYYYGIETRKKYQLLSLELKKIIESNLEKVYKKIEEQENFLKEAVECEKYMQLGNLLLSNGLYKLTDKIKSIQLENYYDENKIITIKLDENLTVSENAQKFFKKYNKLNKSKQNIEVFLEKIKEEKTYLEEVDNSIDNSICLEDIEEINSELEKEGYKKAKKVNKTNSNSQKIKNNFLSFKSEDGLEILVGKNNTQNDYLTTRFAKSNDIWLHTWLTPGSHVIIVTENGHKKVSEKTLLEAGILAAKFSKAKFSSNVCVVYTKVKNVKKPNGSKPGFVIYTNEKALYVNP